MTAQEIQLAPNHDLVAKWNEVKSSVRGKSMGEQVYAMGVYFSDLEDKGYDLRALDSRIFGLSTIHSILAYVDFVDITARSTKSRTEEEKQAFLESLDKQTFFFLLALHDDMDVAVAKLIDGEDFDEIFEFVQSSLKRERFNIQDVFVRSRPVVRDSRTEKSARHTKVVRLREEGKSLGKIGELLCMPKSSVQTELESHAGGRCSCTSNI